MNGRALLVVGLAALPSVVLLAMNFLSLGSDFDAIVLGYRLAIYAGLLLAFIAIALAIRQARRGGSRPLSGLAIALAAAFIVWVGPDAYLDVASVLAGN